MQHSMTWTAKQPRAGIIDDIEREDDSKGYEPEDAARLEVTLLLPAAPALIDLEAAA
ncbi:hypothetical protein [Streptomyces sp. NPDC007856]|uniref:hypothetical protein n=1 Tax=Streptomyces sp. NPDC007856 TaxID=3364781 RepID=UPI0036ABB026